MTNKQKYYIFCETEENIPIFSQAWWLDAVCGTNWDVVLVENHGDIIASMPYHMKKKTGFNIITMPKLTQNMGPYIKYLDNQKYEKRLAFEKKVMFQLIDNLPKFDKFSQNFHYNITNWQPFYWKGFQQTTRYTYVISNTDSLDTIVSAFSKKNKQLFIKGNNEIRILNNLSMKEFYDICKLTWNRQDIQISYSYDLVESIFKVCKEKKCGQPYFAVDEKNNIHAVSFIISDNNTMYSIFGGGDHTLMKSGAKNIILFHCLKLAVEQGLNFDFEGSMIENIADYYRAFGAIQKPYSHITKTSSKILQIKNAFSEVLLNE